MSDQAKQAAAAKVADTKQAMQKLIDDLDTVLAKYEFLNTIAAKTGVQRAYLAIATGVLFVLFVLFGFGAGPVCNLVGFVYPIYASFKAIRTPTNEHDAAHWLTYWVVFAFFTLIESFTDLLFNWVPFYHLFKVIFLIWCYAPQTRGAEKIYKRLIEPYFLKHEAQIEEDITKAAKSIGLAHPTATGTAPAAADSSAHATAASTTAPAAPPAAGPPDAAPAATPAVAPPADAPADSHPAAHADHDASAPAAPPTEPGS